MSSAWTPNAVSNALLRLAAGLVLIFALAIGALHLYGELRRAHYRSVRESEQVKPDNRDFILDRVPYVR